MTESSVSLDAQAAPDLDSLLDAARIAAAQRRSDEAAAAEVLRLLAEADGAMPLDLLLAAGAPRDVVAHLAAEDPTDKRRRPRARLGYVADTPVVWLTSQGWQATGRASGREVAPTSDGIAHAMTPARLAQWLAARTQTLSEHGITVRCSYGGACRRWSAEVTARAWAALRTHSDTDGSVGSCTGGVIPDGLVIASFAGTPRGAAIYENLLGAPPADLDDLAESTYLVEVESHLKASSPLRGKVDQLSAACETLGAARGVLWVVRTRDVARRLRDLGVDDPRRPCHFLVPARHLGLDGEDLGPIRRPWWVTAVPRDDST